jgi:hypothetical protein
VAATQRTLLVLPLTYFAALTVFSLTHGRRRLAVALGLLFVLGPPAVWAARAASGLRRSMGG